MTAPKDPRDMAPGMYYCTLCPRQFTARPAAIRHLIDDHDKTLVEVRQPGRMG